MAGWDKYPPTNMLVKALLDGLSGKGKETPQTVTWGDVPPEAQRAMADSALAGIASKADPNWLPIQRNGDKTLASMPAIFDIDGMRQKNQAALTKLMRKDAVGVRD